MKALLDTHLLIWLAMGSDRISGQALDIVEDESNDLFFSTASIWEIAIKAGLKRAEFVLDPRVLRRELLDNGYEELPIAGRHALAILDLPRLHGDPFDRLLVAQATVEGLVLLTADELVSRYPGPILRV
ncbi:MAG: type II toxin-antitoxin system VapC family toxin [Beijerinckiaceae bacterium]|nr:type II toxin-antitoxin system VapC family toxin [Beijerinckiaceae bacterium]